MNILDSKQTALLSEERRLLGDLRATLAALPAAADDLATLRQAETDLDELFLLVVAGEFNSGKSALINALVSAPLLPEGVTPTTTAVNLIRFSDQPYERWQGDSLVERGFADEWLRHVTLVDTPGTNAVIRRHEVIAERFVPRSDLVLFVTSADRPFTESERAFLERIRQWGKKVVLVLNKVDLLPGESDLRQVLAFVAEQCRLLLGFEPQIFPVAAKLAQQAKSLPAGREREAIWQRSRFAALEEWVRGTLDDAERVRLKLLSPLGVGERLASTYSSRAESDLALLRDDAAAIGTVERQIDAFGQDLTGDFRYRLAEVELIIQRMAERGRRFFDELLRLGRVFDLFNADKVRGQFEREVVGNTAREIEDAVRALSDWLVEREQRLWRSTSEYLERRRLARGQQEVLGEVGRGLPSSRLELLQSLVRTARQAVSSYDREAEARELALSVRTAMAQTAVAEVGAVGLGAVVVALATTAAVDVTGILAAGLIAGLGLFILPLKRRQAQQQFQEKVDELRRRLSNSLSEEFRVTLAHTVEGVRETLGPYVRYVRGELQRRQEMRDRLQTLTGELGALRARIG
ncbi:MAG: dynamin family protein [Chloroflexi bacterium]|nr:dynamin family protein [Chloroflexota bacterium]